MDVFSFDSICSRVQSGADGDPTAYKKNIMNVINLHLSLASIALFKKKKKHSSLFFFYQTLSISPKKNS